MKLTYTDGFLTIDEITDGFYVLPKDVYEKEQKIIDEVKSLRLENHELKKRNAELKLGIGLDPEVYGKCVSDYFIRALSTKPEEFIKLIGSIATQDYQNKHPNPPEISKTPS